VLSPTARLHAGPLALPNVKRFIETLRVSNPARQCRTSSRKRVLRGGG